MQILRSMTIAASIAAVAVPAVAQDFDGQLAARQGQFRLLAQNLGVLGAMAKGELAYDPGLASQAADNLVTITTLHQMSMWPEGSDATRIEGTRAESAIWENTDDFLQKWADLGEAAVELQSAADEGQQALGPALAGMGDACKECHESYRVPDE